MKRKLLVTAAGGLGGLLLFATPASAQEEGADAVVVFTQAMADNLWVFIAGVLVLLMQAGFAMLEAGGIDAIICSGGSICTMPVVRRCLR